VKILAAACLLATLPCAALAQGAAATDGAEAPVAALNAGLVTAMKTGKQPYTSRYAALAPVVDSTFDLPHILQAAVGSRWSSIPADQQKTLLDAFRAYTVSSYVSNFDSDSGTSLRLLPEHRDVGADRVVETEIVPSSGDPTRIDYVMRHEAGGWRAIDVLEEGTISQVAVQRSDFRSLVANGAGPLIESLRAKVATMSGGAIKP
jgi:phospholipid transport system substrate-binding protein